MGKEMIDVCMKWRGNLRGNKFENRTMLGNLRPVGPQRSLSLGKKKGPVTYQYHSLRNDIKKIDNKTIVDAVTNIYVDPLITRLHTLELLTVEVYKRAKAQGILIESPEEEKRSREWVGGVEKGLRIQEAEKERSVENLFFLCSWLQLISKTIVDAVTNIYVDPLITRLHTLELRTVEVYKRAKAQGILIESPEEEKRSREWVGGVEKGLRIQEAEKERSVEKYDISWSQEQRKNKKELVSLRATIPQANKREILKPKMFAGYAVTLLGNAIPQANKPEILKLRALIFVEYARQLPYFKIRNLYLPYRDQIYIQASKTSISRGKGSIESKPIRNKAPILLASQSSHGILSDSEVCEQIDNASMKSESIMVISSSRVVNTESKLSLTMGQIQSIRSEGFSSESSPTFIMQGFGFDSTTRLINNFGGIFNKGYDTKFLFDSSSIIKIGIITFHYNEAALGGNRINRDQNALSSVSGNREVLAIQVLAYNQPSIVRFSAILSQSLSADKQNIYMFNEIKESHLNFLLRKSPNIIIQNVVFSKDGQVFRPVLNDSRKYLLESPIALDIPIQMPNQARPLNTKIEREHNLTPQIIEFYADRAEIVRKIVAEEKLFVVRKVVAKKAIKRRNNLEKILAGLAELKEIAEETLYKVKLAELAQGEYITKVVQESAKKAEELLKIAVQAAEKMEKILQETKEAIQEITLFAERSKIEEETLQKVKIAEGRHIAEATKESAKKAEESLKIAGQAAEKMETTLQETKEATQEITLFAARSKIEEEKKKILMEAQRDQEEIKIQDSIIGQEVIVKNSDDEHEGQKDSFSSEPKLEAINERQEEKNGQMGDTSEILEVEEKEQSKKDSLEANNSTSLADGQPLETDSTNKTSAELSLPGAVIAQEDREKAESQDNIEHETTAGLQETKEAIQEITLFAERSKIEEETLQKVKIAEGRHIAEATKESAKKAEESLKIAGQAAEKMETTLQETKEATQEITLFAARSKIEEEKKKILMEAQRDQEEIKIQDSIIGQEVIVKNSDDEHEGQKDSFSSEPKLEAINERQEEKNGQMGDTSEILEVEEKEQSKKDSLEANNSTSLADGQPLETDSTNKTSAELSLPGAVIAQEDREKAESQDNIEHETTAGNSYECGGGNDSSTSNILQRIVITEDLSLETESEPEIVVNESNEEQNNQGIDSIEKSQVEENNTNSMSDTASIVGEFVDSTTSTTSTTHEVSSSIDLVNGQITGRNVTTEPIATINDADISRRNLQKKKSILASLAPLKKILPMGIAGLMLTAALDTVFLRGFLAKSLVQTAMSKVSSVFNEAIIADPIRIIKVTADVFRL
jgi:hypothetical protein